MLDPNIKDKEGLPLTCRAVFIIGPDKKLKLSLNYPASVGRNMDEIVRVIDALQLSAKYSVVRFHLYLTIDVPSVTDVEPGTAVTRLCQAAGTPCIVCRVVLGLCSLDTQYLRHHATVQATPANWPNNHESIDAKGWAFILPTVTQEDADKVG